MGKYRKFTSEFRGEAVKLVIENSRPIADVARELGLNGGTLGDWVNKYRHEHPVAEELNLPERTTLRELERENRNRDLRLQAEFLKEAAAQLLRASNREREVRAHRRGEGDRRHPVHGPG